MTDTLNERVLKILNNHCEHIGGFTVNAIDDFKFPDLANEIEKLVLNEQYDLLQNFYYGEALEDKEILDFYKQVLETAQEEIKKRINQLNLIP